MAQATKLVFSPMGKLAVVLGSAALGALIVSMLETEEGYAVITDGARKLAGSEATRQIAYHVVDELLRKASGAGSGPLGE